MKWVLSDAIYGSFTSDEMLIFLFRKISIAMSRESSKYCSQRYPL